HCDPGALLQERQRQRPAEPVTAAGDQNALTPQRQRGAEIKRHSEMPSTEPDPARDPLLRPPHNVAAASRFKEIVGVSSLLPQEDAMTQAVRDIMSKDVQCANPETTLKDAASTMKTRDIGSMPVWEG